jgi:hypothetical protein
MARKINHVHVLMAITGGPHGDLCDSGGYYSNPTCIVGDLFFKK